MVVVELVLVEALVEEVEVLLLVLDTEVEEVEVVERDVEVVVRLVEEDVEEVDVLEVEVELVLLDVELVEVEEVEVEVVPESIGKSSPRASLYSLPETTAEVLGKLLWLMALM